MFIFWFILSTVVAVLYPRLKEIANFAAAMIPTSTTQKDVLKNSDKTIKRLKKNIIFIS